MRRNYRVFIGTGIPIVACTLIVVTLWTNYREPKPTGDRASVAHFVSQAEADPHTEHAGDTPTRFASEIRKPSGPPTVEIEGLDPQGRSGTASCATCHSVRPPNRQNRAEDLDEFHQGMSLSHGNLGCYACHNPQDANQLHLADGTAVAYQDVMTLCSQCHGAQATAFEKGAHGGMNGFWDLTRGPQQRNNCIDCHQPHHPQFPKMTPTFKPRDRFLDPPKEGHEAEASHPISDDSHAFIRIGSRNGGHA